MSSIMGVKAVELLNDGIINRVVCFKEEKIVDFDIDEALSMKKTIEDEIIEISKILAL